MVSEVAPRVSASLVLFIYFNPITARGVPRLCEQAKAAGFSGDAVAACTDFTTSRQNCVAMLSTIMFPAAVLVTSHQSAGDWCIAAVACAIL